MSEKRPRPYKHPQINLRIPENLKEKIQKLADKNNRSMNAEIILALEKYLESQKLDLPVQSTKKHIQYSEMEEIHHLLLKNINLMQSVGRVFGNKELLKTITQLAQSQAKVMKKSNKS